MKNRSIPLCIILSIVTCGIYLLYWLVVLTDDLNYASGRDNDTSGALSLVLTIVTCGIYGIYWAYKMGNQLDSALEQRGMPTKNGAVLYLVLSVVGLGFVAWILMQNTINSMISD